jgi:hypothetical protein
MLASEAALGRVRAPGGPKLPNRPVGGVGLRVGRIIAPGPPAGPGAAAGIAPPGLWLVAGNLTMVAGRYSVGARAEPGLQ